MTELLGEATTGLEAVARFSLTVGALLVVLAGALVLVVTMGQVLLRGLEILQRLIARRVEDSPYFLNIALWHVIRRRKLVKKNIKNLKSKLVPVKDWRRFELWKRGESREAELEDRVERARRAVNRVLARSGGPGGERALDVTRPELESLRSVLLGRRPGGGSEDEEISRLVK